MNKKKKNKIKKKVSGLQKHFISVLKKLQFTMYIKRLG